MHSKPAPLPLLPGRDFQSLELQIDSFRRTHVKDIHWYDLTDDIQRIIKRAGVKEGIVVVQTMHTTTTLAPVLGPLSTFSRILVNENESGLVRHDLPYAFNFALRMLASLTKRLQRVRWRHDREKRLSALPNEPKNAASHIASSLYGSVSITLIVHEGELSLGRWQRILFYDFDVSGRKQQGICTRTVNVQIVRALSSSS